MPAFYFSRRMPAFGLTSALFGVLLMHGTALAAAKTPAKKPAVKPAAACNIKGNVNKKEKIYHLPGCASYKTTIIETAKGERMFCSEKEAVAAGWRKAKNCPK
jgi:micrococcal nuclease